MSRSGSESDERGRGGARRGVVPHGLTGLDQGLSEGEIGIQMGISGYTVREHVRRAKLALGARTKPHMVALWLAWEATQQR